MNTDKKLFNHKWFSVYETEKGFIYGQRKGVNSVAVLPCFKHEETGEIHIIIRMQPMPLDNSEEIILFPSPITGTIEEGNTVQETILEEMREEVGLEKKFVHGICRVHESIATTQMNEVVFSAVVRCGGSYKRFTEGDGSVHELVSFNIDLPLSVAYESLQNDNLIEVIHRITYHGFGRVHLGNTYMTALADLIYRAYGYWGNVWMKH